MAENIEKFTFGLMPSKTCAIPMFEEKTMFGIDYLYYGKDNQFPQFLFNLYLNSSLLQSIINGCADFTMGNAVDMSKIGLYWQEYRNEYGDTLEDIMKKAVIDYLIFGGAAILVERNSYGDVSDLYWLDFQNTRTDEDNTMVWYWERGMKGKHKNQYKVYDVFEFGKTYTSSVFYFNGHTSRGVYPVPRYLGALSAIQTSCEISKFHLNSILNNFSGNFIINYNSADYSDEDKKKIVNGIKENFTGTENASKVMVAFNNGKDNAVTVARIPEDGFDKKYEALKNSTTEEIYLAFRAIPQLFGYMNASTGFNTQEFEESFKVFNRTVIKPIQKDLISWFDDIFGIKNCIYIEPFTLDGGDKNVTETTTVNNQPIA